MHIPAADPAPRRATPVDRRTDGSSLRTRILLAVAAGAAIAVSLITLRHVPTPYADLQLYASIARSRQLFGIGVPSETWNSPVAVDHIPFYGPVFFDLCAATLHWFGVTLLSFRIASVIGAAIFVAATAWLARELSGSRDRWLWAVVLIVLAPEARIGIATGVMHMLAIGFQLLALALFVRGLRLSSGGSLLHGALAGGALALAALTTPRSDLFVAAFFLAWILLPLAGHHVHREARLQGAAAAVMFAVPFLIWTVVSHGSPAGWLRYMTYIVSHEDTDVAILPTAVRDFSFSWNQVVTPAVALVGGLLAARGIRRERRAPFAATSAAAFALLTTFLTYVMTVVILNYMFSNGEYFALPLFAVVLAMPTRVFGLGNRTLAALVALAIACDSGLFVVQLARTAATWRATDPTPINEFIRRHVPPGSAVAGPEAPYFFPVERNGSRFRTISARSWADWARWVPIVEADAVHHASRFAEPAPVARFLVWPADDPLPDRYACAGDHLVDRFDPPANYLHLLGRLGHPLDRGYPATSLYRLAVGCPTGYDPTVGH